MVRTNVPFSDLEQKRAFQRQWERENREKRVRAKNDRRKILRQMLREYKQNLKCLRCSESHPACLEFHHPDPSQKDFSVGDAAKMGLGWDTILLEIQKCLVLCANCHRKEHDNGD